MATAIDLSGHVYGKLAVLGFSHRDARGIGHWRCRCSCGEERVCAGNNLRSGNSKTCGCHHGIPIDDPITHVQLLTLVTYHPHTGKFTWNVSAGRYRAGDEAGYYHEANGYIRLIFKKQQYYAHVLAWFYITGTWPTVEIDHEDVDGRNNRWHNLREATHAQNTCNTKLQVRNKTGFKGVRAVGNRFVARVVAEGVRHQLGIFDTPQEAAMAYDQKARELHGQFARTNFGVA